MMHTMMMPKGSHAGFPTTKSLTIYHLARPHRLVPHALGAMLKEARTTRSEQPHVCALVDSECVVPILTCAVIANGTSIKGDAAETEIPIQARAVLGRPYLSCTSCILLSLDKALVHGVFSMTVDVWVWVRNEGRLAATRCYGLSAAGRVYLVLVWCRSCSSSSNVIKVCVRLHCGTTV
jgi:hypothetical protein